MQLCLLGTLKGCPGWNYQPFPQSFDLSLSTYFSRTEQIDCYGGCCMNSLSELRLSFHLLAGDKPFLNVKNAYVILGI